MTTKKFCLAIFMFSTFCMYGQSSQQEAGKSFCIKGDLTGLKEEVRLFITCWNKYSEPSFRDSTITHNGKFEIKGYIKQDSKACLTAFPLNNDGIFKEEMMRDIDAATFFLSDGITEIKGPSLRSAAITGTPLQEEYNCYNLKEDVINAKIDSLYVLSANSEKEKNEGYVNEINNLRSENEKLKIENIKAHPGSYVSLMLMAQLFYHSDLDTSLINNILTWTKEDFGNTEVWQGMSATLEKRKRALPVGSQSIDFTKKNISGNDFTLSSLKGKYVILDFWGSWCGPCRASHPHLVELYAKYKSRGLEIVGIANEKNKDLAKCEELWKSAVKADGMTWIQVLNDDGTGSADLSDMYAIEGFPTKILLDKDGKIIFKAIGNTPAIYEEVRKIFGE